MTTRAIWKGIIKLGESIVPVKMFTALEEKSVHSRLLHAADQLPVNQEMFNPETNAVVVAEEIRHAYETGDDLRCFVEVAAVDPAYFQHAYFLLPAGEVNKAYRLLAEIMEREGRAGIATFVMREREHLVAILAEGGILRAETLRFADELRSPAELGLPPLTKAPATQVKQLRRELARLRRPEFAPELLHDRHAERLLTLVARKLAAGEDVVEKPAAAPGEGAEIIDLMAIIKERFRVAKGEAEG